MANEWHVPYELLGPDAQDMARAIQSLMEELEAVDWYHQRVQVTHDEALRQILEHNRDEEKEHASMIIEWIRRRDPKFDENLRTYLFTSGDILEAEQEQQRRETAGQQESPPPSPTVASPSSPGEPAGAPPGLENETAAEDVVGTPPAFTVGPLRKPRSAAS